MSRTDTEKRKNRRPKVPKGIPVLYPAGMSLMTLYLKLFRHLDLDRSAIKDVKPPYVVLANHQSMVDFGAVFAACRPHDVTFAVSAHFFHLPLYKKLLDAGGCIPKRQFHADITAVRQMMRVIKNGGVLGIFPEGQTCYSGESNEIDRSIGKLLKSLGVPVVNVKIRGNFLTAPKWADGRLTPGYTCAKAEVLLTAEDISGMDAEAIADRVIEGIAYDEYEWQRGVMTPNKKRTIQGLEKYLWRCPQCGKEFTLSSEGNLMTCSSCGLTVTMDEYGFLHSDDPCVPDTPSAWMREQSAVLKQELDAGTVLPITSKAKWLESAPGDIDYYGYRIYGEGDITVDKDGLTYKGTRDGKEFSYFSSPNAQWSLTHSYPASAIDFAGNTPEPRDYAVVPEQPQMMMKIIQLWSLIRMKYFEQ